MLLFKVKKKHIKRKNPKAARTKIGRIMLLSICVVYDSKNSKLIKEQEVRGLLSNL